MKKIYAIGLVVASVALIWGLASSINKLNKPVEGTIISSRLPVTTPSVAPNKILKTAYYTTSYPTRYDLSPKPLSSASLDAEVLVAHQQARYGTGSRITVTVETLPSGGATETSSYKLYASQPTLYTLTQQNYGGDASFLATRTDPNYEAIVLWPHNNLLLTVSLTTAAQSTDTDADLQTILHNFHW